MPARLLAAPLFKNQIFYSTIKQQVLRQAHFFRWLRFHLFVFAPVFPGCLPGENSVQTARLHGQRFLSETADLREPGAVWSSMAGCHVVDRACCRYTCDLGKPAACNALLF